MSLGVVNNGKSDCDDGSDEEVTLAEGIIIKIRRDGSNRLYVLRLSVIFFESEALSVFFQKYCSTPFQVSYDIILNVKLLSKIHRRSRFTWRTTLN